MNEQPVSVSKISWQDLCPWTNIFKALSVAISPSVIVWALVGVVLTPIGWLLSEMMFFDEAMRDNADLTHLAEVYRSPYLSVFGHHSEAESVSVLGVKLSGPRMVFEQMVEPFKALFYQFWGFWEFLYFAFGATWTLLVWAFAGCAITRVSLLRLTRNEALSIDDAFDFACRKYFDCVAALSMPLLGVAILCIPTLLIGLLLSFDIGALLVSLVWFVVLALAFVMVVLLLGLLFGWPLMVASISAEGQNSFDATTRAFAYTLQRPLNYVFYMLVAVLFGGFCWMIVSLSTEAIIQMSYWSTSWGTGLIDAERIDAIQGNQVDGAASSTLATATKIIGFWEAFAKTVAAAFLYGLFWCMASAVYLLLRKDVDETEMDEVFIINEQRTYDLPPLKSDDQGVPQIQDPPPSTTPRQDADE